MTNVFGSTVWGLRATGMPAHDPAVAVVAVAEGADFTLYGCSHRGLELIGRERAPAGSDAYDILARRLEDCDLVLGAETVAALRGRLERAGVAVRPLGAGERRSAVLAAWRVWREEAAMLPAVHGCAAHAAAPALLGA